VCIAIIVLSQLNNFVVPNAVKKSTPNRNIKLMPFKGSLASGMDLRTNQHLTSKANPLANQQRVDLLSNNL
jgi:hypothetical protein